MRKVTCAFVFGLLLTASSAQAVSVRDIIDLTKAGLGEDVLLALIEVDPRVFTIDTETLTRLKTAGVSERVIVAMIRSGRTPVPPPLGPDPAAAMPAEPSPAAPVYYQEPVTTIIREVMVPVPVYLAAPSRFGAHQYRARHDSDHRQDSHGRTSGLLPSITAPPSVQGHRPYLTDTPPPPRKAEPVYWGFGGKLRPDAWQPK